MFHQNSLSRRVATSAITLLSISAISSASAITPKKGGVLVYGSEGDAVYLDPARVDDGASLNVAGNIFDTLVDFKPGTTEVIPSLAERWDISPDNTKFTFHLRKNVKFHDGSPFNAGAVVFSFMRQKDKNHPAHKFGLPYKYWGYMGFDKLIKEVKKVNDHTVVIQLANAEAPFLSTLAMDFVSIVSPKAVMKHKKNFSYNPVGTGPFKFKKWVRKEKVQLDRNKNYWGGAPYLSRVVFKPLEDSSARMNAFLAGEVHMMNLPTSQQAQTLIKNKKYNVVVKEAMNVGYLAFNTQKKPFDNPKVRQALNMAVNKASIIKDVYNNMATPAKNPLPPTLWGYNESVQPYPFSTDEAKKLLAEAGYPKGFKTELWYMPVSRPYMPDGKMVAEALQANFKAINVDVKLQTADWGVYLDKTDKGEHAMALLGWTGDNGDPDNFLNVLLSGDNANVPASNIAFFKDKKVTQLLREARKITDKNVRTAKYKEAQVLIREQAPWIPLVHSQVAFPMAKSVKGFVMSPTGRRDFHKVWLDKK